MEVSRSALSVSNRFVAALGLALLPVSFYIGYIYPRNWTCYATHCAVSSSKRIPTQDLVMHGYFLFYSSIVFLLSVFLLVESIRHLKAFARTRPIPRIEISVAEILVSLYAVGLFAFFYWYYSVKLYSVSNVWIRVSRSIARASEPILGLLMLPVSRNSFLQHLFGLSYEGGLRYHRWLGNCYVIALVAHAIGQSVYYYQRNTLARSVFYISRSFPLKWSNYQVLLGNFGLLAFFLVFVTSFSFIRRKTFELFYYPHFLSLAGIVLAALHSDSTFLYALPGLFCYALDRVVRFWKSHQSAQLVLACNEAESILRLDIRKKGFSYVAGQYVFVNIPSLSIFEWHPFTIAGSGDGDLLTLYIKALGRRSWTRHALEQLADMPEPKLAKTAVYIDGPHGGSVSIPVESPVPVLVFAGGIGITPAVPIVRAVARHRAPSIEGRKTRALQLHWAIRDEGLARIALYRELSADLVRSGQLDAKVYVTQSPQLSLVSVSDGREDKQKVMGEGRGNVDLPDTADPENVIECRVHVLSADPKDFAVRHAKLDVSRVFDKFHELHPLVKRFEVFACGPRKLMDEVQSQCNKRSNWNVFWGCHTEAFDF